jgi:hypothetical protein
MNRKCLLVFLLGVVITTSTYAFFQQWMNMPQQMMQQMVQTPPCECKDD